MQFRAVIVFLLLQSSMIFGQDSASYVDWKVTQMMVEDGATLKWNTINEPDTSTVTIQRFKWNKWQTIGSVKGTGKSTNQYIFDISSEECAYNYRIGYPKWSIYSLSVKRNTRAFESVTFTPQMVLELITFSEICDYEIYDAYGNLEFEGRSDKVNVKKLTGRIYYINYGCEMSKFLKK